MQFDCARCDDLLLDYAYGELDEVTGAAYRRHADGCARCTAALADVRVVRDVFGMLPMETPAQNLDARILAAAEARRVELAKGRAKPAVEAAPRSFWAKLLDVFRVAATRPQYAMAMVLVLVVGIVLVLAPEMSRAPDRAVVGLNEQGTGVVLAPEPAAMPSAAVATGDAVSPSAPPATDMPAPVTLLPEPEALRQHAQVSSADRGGGGRAATARRRADEDAEAALGERIARGPENAQAEAGREDLQRLEEERRVPATEPQAAPPPRAAPSPARNAAPELGRSPVELDGDQSQGLAAAPRDGRAEQQMQFARPPAQAPAPAGRPQRSLGAISQAQPVQPGSIGAPQGGADAYERGMTRFTAGQYRQAIPDLEAAVSRPGLDASSVANAYLAIARSYRQIGSCGEATRRYEELMRRFTGFAQNADVSWEAAECYRALGMTERADQLYRVAERAGRYAERARARRVMMEGARRAARPAPAAADAYEAVEAAPAEAGSATSAH